MKTYNNIFIIKYIYNKAMKNILLLGDILINSRIYTKSSIEDILDSKDVEYDSIRIDSVFSIRSQYLINNPIFYSDTIIDNLERYKMIVLSLYTFDTCRCYKYKCIIDEEYKDTYEKLIVKLKDKCDKLVVIIPPKHYLGLDSNVLWVKDYLIDNHASYVDFIRSMLKKYTFSVLDINGSVNCEDITNYLFNGSNFLSRDNNIKIALILIRILQDITKNSIYRCSSI